MRIGFFVWEYPPVLVGGLGTYASYITRKFVEMGHDVTVFTLNPGKLPTREVIKGVEVHRPLIADATNIFPLFVTDDLRKWGTNIKFFNDVFIYNILSATKFTNELVRKDNYHYDLICIHDWLSSVSGLIIKNELKTPMVFHVHSTEWGRSWNTGSEVVSQLENITAQLSDRIVTVSNVMKDDLIRHGWQETKINVVWNGVDPEIYDPKKVHHEEVLAIREKYRIKEDEQMILHVGRLTWIKGIKNLVQSIPMILKDFPETKLVILGRGEDQRNLIDLVDSLQIKDHVIFRFEFVSEKERILHYAASDACVFPSLYEPFGIVSLEAMAMEKPVVVGAKGVVGFAEQVIPTGPDQNGVHVDGCDVDDIAWGLKAVLKDKELAKQWGENGRKRVLKYFTWDKSAEQTLKIYQNLLSGR
ncbi:MAG: glycosyltransferase family 4 protein [archaeon]|nr:glycosyltransferase family 4 protein [archaeon]